MRTKSFALCAAALLSACAGTASATPLRLDYCVDVLPSGLYAYTFTLTLDNHDNSWVAGQGQGWGWLIFGDIANNTPSPLTNWADNGTVWPVGPWTGYTSSGGGHNGPTMNYVLDAWVAPGLGAQLTWLGTSTANLQEPDMLFSTLVTQGGGIGANFEVAHRLPSCAGQVVGACCRGDGSCFSTTSGNCTAIGGIYRGDNTPCATANCPAGGACCRALGACSILTSAGCTAVSGVYRGDNTTCASAACPGGFTMDCTIPGTFTDISTTGTVLTPTGIDDGYAAFTSSVTNALVTTASLNMCTNGFITDAPFTAFNNATLPVAGGGFGLGLFPDWNDLWVDGTTGLLLHQNLIENGVPVEVIEWYQVQDYSGGTNPRGSFEVKIFGAGGPALVQYLYQGMAWDSNGANSTVGVQWTASTAYQASFNVAGSIPDNAVCSIVQTGVVAPCYANCDHGTTPPCLNVNDFGCFLNQFAAGATYANCDNSTIPPVLNVNDFSCFLNKFAAGCSNC